MKKFLMVSMFVLSSLSAFGVEDGLRVEEEIVLEDENEVSFVDFFDRPHRPGRPSRHEGWSFYGCYEHRRYCLRGANSSGYEKAYAELDSTCPRKEAWACYVWR